MRQDNLSDHVQSGRSVMMMTINKHKTTHMEKMMRQCKHTGVCDVLTYKESYDLLIAWWSSADIRNRFEMGEELWSPQYFFYPLRKRVFEDVDMERMRDEGYAETINMDNSVFKDTHS